MTGVVLSWKNSGATSVQLQLLLASLLLASVLRRDVVRVGDNLHGVEIHHGKFVFVLRSFQTFLTKRFLLMFINNEGTSRIETSHFVRRGDKGGTRSVCVVNTSEKEDPLSMNTFNTNTFTTSASRCLIEAIKPL